MTNVVKYATEVISKHPLAPNFKDLWNYTEVDGPNEQLNEIILAAQRTSADATKGQYGNEQHLYFAANTATYQVWPVILPVGVNTTVCVPHTILIMYITI